MNQAFSFRLYKTMFPSHQSRKLRGFVTYQNYLNRAIERTRKRADPTYAALHGQALAPLASRLEGEGQFNLAKLVRAVADSLCRRETHPLNIPTDKDKLTAEVQKAIDALSRVNVSADLLSALKQSVEFMAQGKLSPITARRIPCVNFDCDNAKKLMEIRLCD